MSAVDVAIVGAGPASLAAPPCPDDLNVVVLERESEAGGTPRHCDHPGYGIRDFRTFISGPAYARRLTADAVAAGVDIRTDTMVTGWAGDTTLEVTSPQGRERLEARAVILATGARERPRSARLIPGDRGEGVYTTGHLQNIVHLKGGKVGTRAVVIGAELVSYSAVLTLKKAGCATALMTTRHATAESYGIFNLFARTPLLGVRIATRTRLCRIIGKPASPASNSSTSTPASARSSSATPSCSPATGSRTMNWPGPPDSTSTRPRWGRSSTPPCAPAGPVYSLSAT